MNNLKVGTHFSGIGAPEQALKDLSINFTQEFACEVDKRIRDIYYLNHSCKIMYNDIRSMGPSSNLPYVDLLVAGFPCQDISIAGKGNLSTGRTTLVSYTLDYIDAKLPKYVILENVKMLLSSKFSNFYNNILTRLHVNYYVFPKVFNSCNFGVPQNRERVFITCVRKNSNKVYNPPNQTYSVVTLFNIMENTTLNALPPTHRFYTDPFYVTKTGYRQYDKTTTSPSSKGMRSSYERVYTGNCISPTLTTKKDLPLVLDGPVIRPLTDKERLRLQGFPDNFNFGPHQNLAAHCLGNSITVNVLKEIMRNLL